LNETERKVVEAKSPASENRAKSKMTSALKVAELKCASPDNFVDVKMVSQSNVADSVLLVPRHVKRRIGSEAKRRQVGEIPGKINARLDVAKDAPELVHVLACPPC
jgi:hypothetical protein